MKTHLWLLYTVALSSSALPCFASGSGATRPSSATDPAAAEALFEEGRAALAAGNDELACSKFAESQRLDPGAGTLMNWATCEEKLGRIASAWQHFQQAFDALPDADERAEYARQRAADLEQRLPMLTLKFPEPIPPGTVVLRDGVALEAASLGTPLPIDPGPHAIAVRSPSRQESHFFTTLVEAEHKELALHPGAPVVRREPPKRSTVLAWTLVGVGAAGVGAGVATSVMLQHDRGVVDRHCDGKLCDEQGIAAAERGETLVWANLAAWSVGAVSLGSGVVLLLAQPTATQEGPPPLGATFSRTGAVLRYRGRF